MKIRRLLPIALAACLFLPTTSCATIAGTVVSPVTGGVNLATNHIHRNNWWMAPIYFVGGMVSGPFVAFYNGVNYDTEVFADFDGYWTGFGQVFQPFDLVKRY